jgi:hypothetical protein
MSSIRPRLAPFAAVLALALVLAGCGGGSGGSEPLSKQEYRKQFNAIGKRFLTQVGSLQTRLSRTNDPGKRAAALDAATAAFRSSPIGWTRSSRPRRSRASSGRSWASSA